MGHAIREMREGESYEGVLWLVAGQVRQTKNGDPFWEGTFQDATGTIGAKLWDSAGGKRGRVQAFAPALEAGRAVHVAGLVDAFQGTLQLNLSSARTAGEGEYDPSWFSPRSGRSSEEMLAEFEGIVAGMKDSDYKKLLKAFRHDREMFDRFCAAPAAKAIHHAWVGGLLEHSLSLARGVLALAPNYPALDGDLLLCGCFLHDAGKALEISADPGFEYTADGRLLGHISMGARYAERLCEHVKGFPDEKRRLLLHLILSHQGDRSEGFGSPIDPATPEAVFFHQLDNLDAKVQSCLTTVENAGKAGEKGPFTLPKTSPLRKSYYRGEGPEKGDRRGGEQVPEPEPETKPEPEPPGDGQPTLW